MENIVIGIEGLVGVGKTSICKELLKIIPNSIIIHGGNLYRAIVYALYAKNTDIEILKKTLTNIDIVKFIDELKLEIELEERETQFYIDGKKISEEDLQSKKSSIAVSEISNIADNKNMFKFAKDLIDSYRKKYNIILSGRALKEIYPELTYHLFLEADLDIRVNRKFEQYENKLTKTDIKEMIIKRDILQEKSGFYRKYADTITIDLSNTKSILESTEVVLKAIEIV